MPETSNKPFVQKLGLKATHRWILLHAPKEVDLGKLPTDSARNLTGQFDLVLAFYESAQELHRELPRLKRVLKKAGMAWVCWRKGNVTDLSRDRIWELALAVGLEAVGSISVDPTWSALKLMLPKAERA